MTKLYQPLSKTLAVLLLTLLTSVAWAQSRTITGKVISSDDGTSMPGVNIIEKGTNNGTATDADGRYSISVKDNAVLIFSFVGSATQEIPVGAQNSIDVSLAADITSLSEVVVVGYETIRKKDLTGSVAQVAAADLNKGIYTSPAQLLQGKLAGVVVVSTSGAPGAENTIQIRGPGSFRGGSAPLIVVDGIQLDNNSSKAGLKLPGALGDSPGIDPFSFINGADIDRIDVLKDASATAIYGSRGANGVIMITTKKAKSGEMNINFGASVGVSTISKKLDVLTGDQYRAALISEGVTGGDYGSNANAFDEIIRTGSVQNYNLSFSAGSDHSTHRASVGYTDQKGILEKSGLKKYNAMLQSNYSFFEDRVKLDVLVMGAHIDQQSAPVGNNSPTDGNLISQALQWNPTNPLREDGIINQPQSNVEINPLATLAAVDDNFQMDRMIASIAPTIRLAKGLEYKLQVAIDHSQGDRYVTQKKSLLISGTTPGIGQALYNTSKLTTQQYSHTLSYTKEFEKLTLAAILGYEFQNNRATGFTAGATNFTSDDFDFRYNFANVLPANTFMANDAPPDSKLQSFFGRATIGYNDKYRLTATVRTDGSSKFGAGNRYGVFPAVGFAWNLDQEDFMPDALQTFKLRLGWGATGSQSFPSGLSTEAWAFGQGGGTATLRKVNNYIETLKWETSITKNLGIDFGIFNSRLTGSIDVFEKKTRDQLFNSETALPGPSNKFWTNVDGAIIRNRGVEIVLLGDVVDNADFKFAIGANVSFLNNKFVPEGKAKDFLIQTGALDGKGLSGVRSQVTAAGHPVNSFYLPVWKGFNEDGESVYEDEFANVALKKFVGSPLPKMTFGVTFNLNYKKFDAVVATNGVTGNMIYNNTANAVFVKGNLGSRNTSPDLIGNGESFSNEPAPSTRFLEKGDFLRLSNLTIGYTPDVKFAGMKHVRVYATAQNLFVITGYSGFDPEVNTNKSVDGVPSLGIDYTQYPKARTFLVGVNVTF